VNLGCGLMIEGVAGLIGAAVVAILTPLAVGFLGGAIGRAEPDASDKLSGAIVPELVSALLTVMFGLLCSFTGLWALISGGGALKVAGVWGLALRLPIALFMSPSLTKLHVLRWSEQGVDGPASLFGPTLGLRRTFLRWSDITGFGQTSTGYWYLETAAGERVYWSYLYKGHRTFAQAIDARRPDLGI